MFLLYRRVIQNTQTTTKRAPSAKARTSTTPWLATVGSSVPPPAPTVSPALWGKSISTLSSLPPSSSPWTPSTSKLVPESSAQHGVWTQTGMKVWSSVAPSCPSAQMRVSSTQLKRYIAGGTGSALFPIILFCHSHLICSDTNAKHKRTSLRWELKCLMFVGFCLRCRSLPASCHRHSGGRALLCQAAVYRNGEHRLSQPHQSNSHHASHWR